MKQLRRSSSFLLYPKESSALCSVLNKSYVCEFHELWQTPSGSSGWAIPAYCYAKMLSKPQLSYYFHFLSIPNKNSSSKCLQSEFLQELPRSSWWTIPAIYHTQRHRPHHLKIFGSPLAQYTTKILLESSRSCGILQPPSGSSGQAIPAYFRVKMHPKPYLNNYFHFLVNPEQEFSI